MGKKDEVAKLQGAKSVWYGRKLSDAATVSGTLIPAQTGSTFDMSRDSDTTVTKDGAVPTTSALETEAGVEFVNNTAAIADYMYDSLIDGDKMEFWKIHLDRKNDAGQYFAWYLRAVVSEDSGSDDPDDNSTREVSFAVEGTPKRGWVTLSVEAQAEIDYVFRGIEPVTDEDDTGDGVGWKTEDAGTNAESGHVEVTDVAVSNVTLTPTTVSVKEGESTTLTTKVAPDNASDKAVTYKSSDDATAKVDDKGVVTGVKAGTADITVTTKDGNKTAKSAITVTAK